MDRTREARRSTTTMAASNGVTKRRKRLSENSREQMHQEVATVRDRPGKKERDPESFNRSKRRRSERFAPRNERDVEEDSSDESQGDDDVQQNYQRKSFPSGRIPRHAASLKVTDEMIGVAVPRKARSACIKRSHDCRTSSGSGGGGFREDRRRPPSSPGSHSFEVVSPSSSTLSVKQKKILNGSKSRMPKPPKSSGTAEDDLEIEIAEVLSGLKKQPHSSKRGDHSENSQKSSEVKETCGLITCKARGESANIDKLTNGTKTSLVVAHIHKEKEPRLDSEVSKGVSDGPQLENNKVFESHSTSSKLDMDLMVPPTMPSSPGRVSLLPLVSDYCKRDSSLKSKENVTLKTPEEVKQKKVEKREWLNLDIEGPNQETGRDSNLSLQNLDWSQPQQAKSAQHSSVLPLPVAVGSSPSVVPPRGYVPLIQTGTPVDGSNGSSTLVQPRPKRCATHFFIARNIQLHQHFVKTNHLSTPNKGSVYLKGGDLRPAAGNPSLQGSSPILSLNSQAPDRIVDNISVPKDKASESGHFASTRQNKPQPPPASISVVPAPAFIFPANHHLQPVMVPSKSSRPTKCPRVAVGSASVNFTHPSSSASEVSSPYFTVLPNNAYSFQLSSTIRGGTPSQAVPFYNGSFYSPQMFQQHPQPLQRQSQAQRESKASSCSSSSHRQPQPQPQVSVNTLSSQANVQQHRQMSQKSEAKAAGDNTDSRGSHTQKGGPFGQIMTAPVQPQNFSMSFASFANSAAPATLNFSSNGYHIISTPPGVTQQNNHQSSEAKTGGGSCSSNAEDPKKNLPGKPPGMMNGQTLVFDNPSRTLNFVSGTWPPPAATAINGDPSVFTQHLTQRQQQSGRSKMMTHSQADSVSAPSSQWKNPATSSSLTSGTSLNLKQFQSQQQTRTHGQTQISFAAPSNPQPSQGKQGRSGGSSSSVTGYASHGKAANPKVSNSKALPLSPVPLSREQTENSASGSSQKSSPVCGRTVPPIITLCPGHLSELKY
ncbi:protein TIME FOR COFFEE isoform X2 [Arabidopsis lyrata subsp. lyrata]|uniref:protein TIME FOR COFFEE isoform X2 n=1 Tax=Arabidopsis lyrata subsp. lyrata TaxID=81972 RepID=UPI000A29B33F|nr:protein TIME FOR COFFEE isoform X2 [Arabidopsis lyrata subsp. lyrata]|eukprot:XP_020880692.1 protein TIME FOR COFFEE isoform X2 [Arabidopsis lyrata subsp. lyrata]